MTTFLYGWAQAMLIRSDVKKILSQLVGKSSIHEIRDNPSTTYKSNMLDRQSRISDHSHENFSQLKSSF